MVLILKDSSNSQIYWKNWRKKHTNKISDMPQVDLDGALTEALTVVILLGVSNQYHLHIENNVNKQMMKDSKLFLVMVLYV